MGSESEYEPQDLIDMERAEGEGMVARAVGIEEELLGRVVGQFWRCGLDLEEVIHKVAGEMDEGKMRMLLEQLRQFLGEAEWQRLEKEELSRVVEAAFYLDATPG